MLISEAYWLLFLQMETTKREVVGCFNLIFKLFITFSFCIVIPLNLVYSSNTGSVRHISTECSQWRQVSPYLLRVNHMLICFTWPWPSSCYWLSVIKDKTLADGGSSFSLYLRRTTSRWILYSEWHLTNTMEANPANRLVLQMFYLLGRRINFPLYMSPSLHNQKKKKSMQKPEGFTFLLINPCW